MTKSTKRSQKKAAKVKQTRRTSRAKRRSSLESEQLGIRFSLKDPTFWILDLHGLPADSDDDREHRHWGDPTNNVIERDGCLIWDISLKTFAKFNAREGYGFGNFTAKCKRLGGTDKWRIKVRLMRNDGSVSEASFEHKMDDKKTLYQMSHDFEFMGHDNQFKNDCELLLNV